MSDPEDDPQNPFASPSRPRETAEHKPWGSILRLARYQRWVSWALLLNVPLTILFLAVVLRPATFTNMLIARLFLSTMLLAVVTAYHIGSELYSRLVGIFLMLIAFVPGISIVLLALLNHQTIQFLNRFDVNVGVFGANLGELRQRAKRELREVSHHR